MPEFQNDYFAVIDIRNKADGSRHCGLFEINEEDGTLDLQFVAPTFREVIAKGVEAGMIPEEMPLI